MRITHFKVENYRSIQKTNLIPLKKYTVFLGKNNEGKSNILRALECAIKCLDGESRGTRMGMKRQGFSFERDFPVSKQEEGGTTKFRLDFEFSKEDKDSFFELFKIKIDGKIPVGVKIGTLGYTLSILPCSFRDKYINRGMILSIDKLARESVEYKILLDGGKLKEKVKNYIFSFWDIRTFMFSIPDSPEKDGLFSLFKKNRKLYQVKSARGDARLSEVVGFISQRLSANYIQSVRTEEYISEILNKAISFRMREIEEDEKVKKALEIVEKAEEDLLEDVAKEIKMAIKDFIPMVKGVKLARRHPTKWYGGMHRGYGFQIDDGNLTVIQSKGDGVKSLLALGLFKNKIPKTRHSVIGIDEPEAHLHPGAIRELNSVIEELSKTNQIVIATHCPVFVDRKSISSNIIVDKGTARPAEDIKEIRELLGVVPADNMINSSLIVLVEGECDKKILKRYFELESQKINKGLMHGEIVIEAAGGASKVPTMCQVYQGMLANVVCVFDYDAEGKSAFKKIEDSKILNSKDLFYSKIKGSKDCEVEDCINVKVINEVVQEYYDIEEFELKSSKKKWSKNLEFDLDHQGITLTETALNEIKNKIVERVQNESDFVHPAAVPFLKRIKNRVESLLK
ncbi:ATP-binding protein [Desulfobaculum bizertense]|uniref:AAA family ATPase n=1 Tax=Desulfobaculum bizertense TaxID=376490 RepID=UPI001F235D08|nr:AAA family ATPase [Desulfobaculum bizertense]UIJ36880.1 ATP-binding protein [Desulfobaculum bizertense]